MRSRRIVTTLFAFTVLCWAAPRARAEDVTIAQQYGISYLPLTVMREKDLLTTHAKAEGLDLTANWLSFTGGPPMNEALISGNLDIASGGVAPLLLIWDRTRTSLGVRGLAALESMPLYLNTSDPAVKTLADFKGSDRIALPAAKVSIQAIVLAMAATKAGGKAEADKLSGLSVSMAHPDGLSSLVNGTAGITAHFTAMPYQNQELDHPNIHRVLSSYDVLGGSHTFNVVWTTKKFVDRRPKVAHAFLAALADAETFIKEHPAEAAAIWVKAEKSTLSPAAVEKLIRDPEVDWTMKPERMIEFGAFMHTAGIIHQAPASVSDIFFPGDAAVLNTAGGDNAGAK